MQRAPGVGALCFGARRGLGVSRRRPARYYFALSKRFATSSQFTTFHQAAT